METGFMNRIIGLVLALVVGGLLVGGLLIPSIEGITTTEKTFENEGYFHMNKYGTEDEITIFWNHETPKKVTVNDTDIALDTPVNQFVNLAIGDNWYYRYANGASNFFIQANDGTITDITANTQTNSDLEAICSGGTVTFNQYIGGELSNTKTATYTECYIISGDSGNYVMKKSNESVYMAGNTPFIAYGRTTGLNTQQIVSKITGDINDGANVSIVASSVDSTFTVKEGSVNVNYTPLANYKGYELSTITYSVIDQDSAEYDITYNYFIVPAKVTIELSQHLDVTEIAMFGVISLLGIVMLVVVAANAIRNKY